jgi:hypothetical protein
MKGCRRCQFERLDTVREAVNRRGGREYITYWYRCPRCHEVSLSFRRVQHLPWLDVARSSVIEEPDSAPAPFPLERDPALTR